MKKGQVIAVVVVIGISCLSLGAALGYAIHFGETVTSLKSDCHFNYHNDFIRNCKWHNYGNSHSISCCKRDGL